MNHLHDCNLHDTRTCECQVGAGLTGLTAALALARNNVPVRIIEKDPQNRRGQRGVGIHEANATQPRTFEVFHFLHAPEIHERATFFPPLQEHDKGLLEPLNIFSMAPYTEPTPAIPYYNSKAMGQPTLEAIMREHLARLDCTVELGTRLFSFVQDEKCVRVKVAKHRGDNGEEVEEDIEVAYLIGADGAKGITRKQLGLTFLGTTREDGFYGTGRYPLGSKRPWSGCMISFRPTDELGKDGWQFFMSSRTIDLKGLLRDEEALVNCIQDSVGLKDDVRVKEVMPNMRMVNKLGVGRVFVAGDAAHVHSPAGGQRMNSSVQDAFNIAWKIALVYKGLSPASLLDTYTAERLPVIAEMLGFTTELHDRTFDQLDVEHTARTTTDENSNSKKVESKFERAMRRGGEMFILGVNYRTSPIVIDEFVPTPTSESGVAVVHSVYGDGQEGVLREGNRSTRMFDTLAWTHHTVIIFAPALAIPVVRSVLATLGQNVPKELVRRVVVLPGSASAPDGSVEASSEVNQAADVQVLVDHAGHAYRGYIVESQEVKIVVVRPDGVVGAIVRGVTGLERYFEGVLERTEGMDLSHTVPSI
ncbi:FAD binding domain-containing protein [Pisolithus sp. B1]|nr:FAD binding domain-containing protein [Pisolithus sp. B1]